MITELTKKQEHDLYNFRDYCYKEIGLNTNPIEKKNHWNIFSKIYKNYLGHDLKYIWYCDSPFQYNLIINILNSCDKNLLSANLRGNLRANLGDNLCANLRGNLRANLGDNLCANLRGNLRANLGDNLWDNLWDNLGDNLGANLRGNLWDNLRGNLWDNLGKENKLFNNVYWSNYDIFWIAFYYFPYKYLGIDYGKEKNENLENLFEMTKNCGFLFFHKEILFVCENPIEINLNSIGQLHADGKPSMLFKDGYCLYNLNGVRVPKELVLTSGHLLDSKKWIADENVEVRREFIRKAGNEKICNDLNAKCIDSKGDYELLILELGNNINGHYLKMKNPSIGVYHIECVAPECDSVEKALNWRNQSNKKPIILT